MDVLGLEAYRAAAAGAPVPTDAAAAAAKQAPAPPLPPRDSAAIAGNLPADPAAAGADALLGKLHESGLLESASRPLEGETPPPDHGSARVTVRLPEGAVPEGEAEWRPYQPPVPSGALPTALSEDGKRLILTLFGMGEEGGGALNLGALALPLDPDGALLAQLSDGSLRLLVLNQAVLDSLLELGTLSVDAFVSPERASGAGTGERTGALPLPLQTDPAPWAQEPELPPLPESDTPEAVARWAGLRAAARSFTAVTERWLAAAPAPLSPEARAELETARNAWAAELRREAPALFRAWTEAGGWSGDAQEESPAEPRTEEAVREAAVSAGSPKAARSAPQAAAQGAAEDRGMEWLRSQFPRLFPHAPDAAEEKTLALLRSAYGAPEAQKERNQNELLSRRVADYLHQLLSGRARYGAGGEPALRQQPREPETGEGGARDEAWKRRRIGFAVDSEWTDSLSGWLEHVRGWRVSRCRDYVNARANDWTSALMRERPAGFRHWLSSPLRHAASTGWFNGATGSFPINTLPEGFTDEDFRRWVSLDVLDYL